MLVYHTPLFVLAGIERTIALNYVHFISSDGKFERISSFAIQFVDKDNDSNLETTVYQMFPTSSLKIPYQRQLKLTRNIKEDTRVIYETEYGSVSEVNQSLKYFLSSSLIELMCINIFQSIMDKVTVTTRNEDSTNAEVAIFNVNISFLNVNSEIAAAFSIETKELLVVESFPSVINSSTISAKGLAHLYSVCDSTVRVGFLVTYLSQGCTIEGTESSFMLFWDEILSSKYRLFCEGDASLNSVHEFTLNIALKQNDRLWVVGEYDYTVPIRIVSASVSYVQEWACPISLLQGYNFVSLSPYLLDCFGQEIEFSTTFIVTEQPLYGKIVSNHTSMLSFTIEDLRNNCLIYVQTNSSKTDWFKLSQQQPGAELLLSISVPVIVKPNIVSKTEAIVLGHEPIILTTEMLDAAPLMELSLSEAIYVINKLPTFGRLVRESEKKKRAVTEPLTQFTHSDVANHHLLYYPPKYIPEENEDNFTYTLTSERVQPADGVFHVLFNSSQGFSIPPVYQVLSVKPSNHKEMILTIIVISSCVFVCAITILVTVLCLRNFQKKKMKYLARQKRVNSEPRLILARENGSYKLLIAGGDEFLTKSSDILQYSPLSQIDNARMCEASLTIPQVKVTPLRDKEVNNHDMHDYVNYPKKRMAHSEFSLCACECSNRDETTTYCSIEQLPPIKRPNYAC